MQFTSLPATVLMDDDKPPGEPGASATSPPSPSKVQDAAAGGGRTSFVGSHRESVSGGLFHGFTYESPTMLSLMARQSNAADLGARSSRAGSLALLPGFSFAEAPAPAQVMCSEAGPSNRTMQMSLLLYTRTLL
jgi:hypothetical protein